MQIRVTEMKVRSHFTCKAQIKLPKSTILTILVTLQLYYS